MSLYDSAAASSGAIAASAQITTVNAGACLVSTITLLSGTAASSMTLRDGGASGTIKWKISLIATTAAGDQNQSFYFDPPLAFGTDLYATMAGTAAVGYIAYIPQPNSTT